MKKLKWCLVTAAVFASSTALSWQVTHDSIVINLKGRAIIIPCHINNDVDIDIDFGTVGVQAIKSGNQFVERWIPVQCDSRVSSYSLKIESTSSGSELNALATTIPGLEISLLEGGNRLALNTFFKPKNENGLMLKSQLAMTKDFASGTEGKFSASATLTTQYD